MDIRRLNHFLLLSTQQRLILIACAVTLIGLDLALIILAADLFINHLFAPVVITSTFGTWIPYESTNSTFRALLSVA